MTFHSRHLRRLWSAVRRTPSDEDFARELRFHLDQAEAELRGRGYSRADAQRVVRTRSGGFFQALEALRAQRGLGRTMDLWDDVRYAVRRLVMARRFTMAASTALALGIGANTMVFTMVNAILIRNLPFDDPDRIVAVWTGNPEGQRQATSYPDYEDWRDQAGTLAGLSAHTNGIVNVSDDEQVPDRVFGAYVSPNFFRLLGEQPVLGRDFDPDDDRDGAEPVVLIGHGLWETRYGRDAGVLGRTIRVNALPATVVGVMAPGMRFPNDTDIWIPRVSLPPEWNVADRGTRSFAVIGRLGPGASVDQARQELRAIGARLAEAYPDTNRDRAPDLVDYLDFVTRGEPALLTLTLMGAVAFVLLIACANVANLLLARATGRRREIAVRVAMGATRLRIVRQLLIESLVLALVAGAVGFLLSILGIRWISGVTRSAAIGMPYWIEFTLDGTVFAFTAALCLVTAIAFGLVPALRGIRNGCHGDPEGGDSRQPGRRPGTSLGGRTRDRAARAEPRAPLRRRFHDPKLPGPPSDGGGVRDIGSDRNQALSPCRAVPGSGGSGRPLARVRGPPPIDAGTSWPGHRVGRPRSPEARFGLSRSKAGWPRKG